MRHILVSPSVISLSTTLAGTSKLMRSDVRMLEGNSKKGKDSLQQKANTCDFMFLGHSFLAVFDDLLALRDMSKHEQNSHVAHLPIGMPCSI